jgi:flagellar M-ring protein FliF
MEKGTVIESTVLPNSQISLSGVLSIPAVRQFIMLIGVAAAVAAGFAIILWSQAPGFTQLYGSMAPGESAEVADALRAAGIEYELDPLGGILVEQTKLHDARLQLAAKGLPQSAGAGMDSMQEQSSFGVSQFMESARYQHALEAELARTISSLGAVRVARVHLALPKQSAFIREAKHASASVLLHLGRGRTLEADQASAIVHLVASSVANLNAGDVTLVDQNGRMLSSGAEQPADAMAATQFKYARKLEETFKRRIENLLTPLLGAGRVRAEVVADIDFTYTEETSESFDPTRTVVRSEQTSEDSSTGDGLSASGIPGALSNQPPEAVGIAPDERPTEAQQVAPRNTSRSSTRNFEVDRTIRHTRPQSGVIRKLSIAVLIDDSPLGDTADTADTDTDTDATAVAASASIGDAEIERYTSLVKEAVGFNAARGDSVVVLSEAFLAIATLEADEPLAIWERPMVRDILKQVLGAIVVLAIAFGIVRPMLRGVVASGSVMSGELVSGGGEYTGSYGAPQLAGGVAALPMPNYDEKVAAAKNITGHDPARVAQVVKRWVTVDD